MHVTLSGIRSILSDIYRTHWTPQRSRTVFTAGKITLYYREKVCLVASQPLAMSAINYDYSFQIR